jgi:hypothetical protein
MELCSPDEEAVHVGYKLCSLQHKLCDFDTRFVMQAWRYLYSPLSFEILAFDACFLRHRRDRRARCSRMDSK